MNKQEFVSELSDKTGVAKKDIDAVLKAMPEIVTSVLKKGEKIQLVGFGTFEAGKRAARTGRNPQTGEKIKIPASKVPKFKISPAIRDAINKKK